MSTDRTSLGDRMKRYEASYKDTLPRRTPAIIRVDGRAFHTLLRGAMRPFDPAFMTTMDYTAAAMCEEISGAVFAYVQSDEISVLVSDYQSLNTEPWFGGVVAKWISISASIATASFNRTWGAGRLAHFDSRVFTLSDTVEVANYFVWRQQDATRNSIQMAGQSKFSHNQLRGVNTDQIQEMLWQQHNINWNDYPEGFKRGRVVVHSDLTEDTTRWRSAPAPIFKAEPGSFLAGIIPTLPSLTE